MKKLIAIVLVISLLACLFAGCGAQSAESDAVPAEGSASASAAEPAEEAAPGPAEEPAPADTAEETPAVEASDAEDAEISV